MVDTSRARTANTAEQAGERTVQTVLMPINPAASEAIDFVALGTFVKRHWLLIFGCCFFGAACGYGVSHLFPKIYRANVLLSPVSADDSGMSPLKSLASRYGSLASLAGVNLDAGGYATSTVVAMLQSRRFLQQFISDNKLLPILFADRWDKATSSWKNAPKNPPPSLDDGYEVFTKKVMSVSEDRKTSLVTVQIEWRDAERASDWANILVARVNATTRDLAIHNANLSIDYLNAELRTAETVELRQSIFALLQSQMEKRMLASTRPEFSFQVIDPAQAPNPRHYVSPQRIRFVFFGMTIGLLIGFVVAGVVNNRARERSDGARSSR